ncbi:hypothetical protein [Propionivibrio dicarboxylicus]|nr:hypothetical protein [Propionivibrio dicarboxylicus]
MLITTDRNQLAVIVVTLAAVAITVYSVMAFGRIARCIEEGYARQAELAADLRGTEAVLNANCSRLASAVERLEKTQKDIEAGPKQSAGNNQDPVSGLSSFSRVELARLLAQNTALEASLNEAQNKLRASDKLIIELRRQKLAAEEAEAVLARLHAQNQRLLTNLRDTRRRLREAEQKSEPGGALPVEGEACSGEQERTQTHERVAENLALRGRIKVLELESNQMRAKIDEREEELARTLREKTLIEERFVQRELSEE